jgi:hypothetical protein
MEMYSQDLVIIKLLKVGLIVMLIIGLLFCVIMIIKLSNEVSLNRKIINDAQDELRLSHNRLFTQLQENKNLMKGIIIFSNLSADKCQQIIRDEELRFEEKYRNLEENETTDVENDELLQFFEELAYERTMREAELYYECDEYMRMIAQEHEMLVYGEYLTE